MSIWSDGRGYSTTGKRPLPVLERDMLIVEYFASRRDELMTKLRWENEEMRKELAELKPKAMAAGA